MQNSKLIGLLKVLSEEELERFRAYIQSPFFKKTAKAVALFEWIDAQNDHPVYQAAQLEVALIGKYLFPHQKNEVLRKKSLSVVSSELVGLIKDFLIQLKIEEEKSDHTHLLLGELRKRRLEKEFWQAYKKELNYLNSIPKTIQQYHQAYFLDISSYYFRPTDKQVLKEWKKGTRDMHKAFEHLDTYVLLHKLQYCCHNWNEANVWLREKNRTLADELIVAIEAQQLTNNLLVKFYYLTLLLLMHPEKSNYFFELKTLLKNHDEPIHKRELRGFYTIAVNYCNRKINQGRDAFYQEMLDLYELMFKQKMLYVGKFIEHKFVKNIVGLGLQLGKIDWVSGFIEKTKNDIIPQYRQSVYSFNKAALYFYTKEYTQALQELLKVESIGIFYDLDYRGLLLKCYYELEETDALFSLADAFRKFVQQQKISDGQKKSYLHFIRCVQRLYKVKIHPNPSNTAKDKVKQFILEIQPVNNRKWLLEKVEELS